MGSRYNIVKAKGTAEQTPVQSAGSRYNINNRNETVGQRLNDSVKYTAASLGAGIAGVGEGISDILNAVASIGSGADYAKKAFAQNDVGNWMEGIRQETRPNAVVQFAGDVAQGIGQSSVFLLDAVVPFLGTGLFFSGITGQSIGNAVNETGDLSWREVGYGIASGAQEALVEKLIGAGGQAAGNLMSTVTKGAVQKTIGKQAATSGARNILINVAKAAGGEFAEEFTEEFTDVGLKRLFRIDPEARITTDTWKQALYSGAAGAVSGGLMASPTIVANYKGNERRGRAIVDSGRTEAVIRLARSSAETAGVSLDLGKAQKAYRAEQNKADASRTVGDKLLSAFNEGLAGKERRETSEFRDQLAADLETWDSLTDEQKASAGGMALLGQIEANVSFHDINLAIDRTFDELAAGSDEELAPFLAEVKELTGKEYTAAEFREDKDGVARQVAAVMIMEDMRAQIDELTADNVQEAETAEKAQEGTQTAETAQTDEKTTEAEKQQEVSYRVNARGRMQSTETGRGIRLKKVATNDGQLVIETEGNERYPSETLRSDQVEWSSDKVAAAVRRAEELQMYPLEAERMIRAIEKGTELDGRAFAEEYHLKYLDGVYAKGISRRASRLGEYVAAEAYMIGEDRAKASLRKKSAENVSDDVKAKAAEVRRKASEAALSERVILPEGMTFNDIRGQGRKAVFKAADILSRALGIKIVFYTSYQETKDSARMMRSESGQDVAAPNGWFETGTNVLHLDLNAGNGADGAAIFTMAHEAGHWLMDNDAAGFRDLGEFLFNHIEEDPEDLISERQAFMEANGRLKGMSAERKYAAAYEDVVCDLLSPVLKDGNTLEMLAYEHQGILSKLWSHIKNIIKNIREALKSAVGPTEISRLADGQLKNAMSGLEELFAAVAETAADNYAVKAVNRQLLEQGIAVDEATDTAMFSERDIPKNETEINLAVDRLVKSLGVTREEARRWVDQELSTASLILDPKFGIQEGRDYWLLSPNGDRRRSAVQKNSDYPQGTLDFSNICRKRRDYTKMMQRLQRAFPKRVFTAEDYAQIREIMVDEGATVACGLCFVEDRRQSEGLIAQTFINAMQAYRAGDTMYRDELAAKRIADGDKTAEKDLMKSYNAGQQKALSGMDKGDAFVPDLNDLTTLDGMKELRKNHKSIADAWEKFNNARGMASSRLLQNESEYQRQILKYTKQRVARINALGGLRIYSFSDFEEFHIVDLMQAIQDCAAVGLKIQCYTKVPAFARMLMDTGVKVNRSLIPKGRLGYHMEGGRVVLDYDNVEGIDTTDPDYKYVPATHRDVGNILVGINDTQIKAAMLDPFIHYIIPYHTSQTMKVREIKKIDGWVNYKDEQTDKKIKGNDDGKKTKDHGINIYTDVLEAAEKAGAPIRNERQFVEKFLAVCKEKGYVPRFERFLKRDAAGNYLYTEGYYKLLLDFKLFDEQGNIIPQKVVRPEFDVDFIHTVMQRYIDSTEASDAKTFKEEKIYKRIVDEVVDRGDGTLFSDRDVGYHAGDLGKSIGDDYFGQGYSRGTGHFGFGTYFVGDEAQINDGEYGKRPHEKVDFGKYNLFKPRNAEQGYRLHDALKVVDGYAEELSNEPKSIKEMVHWETEMKRAAKDLILGGEGFEDTDEEVLENRKKIDKLISEMPAYYRDKIENDARDKYDAAQELDTSDEGIKKYLEERYKTGRFYKDIYDTADSYVRSEFEDEKRNREDRKSATLEEWKYRVAEDTVLEYISDQSKKWEKLSNLPFDLHVALGMTVSEDKIKEALKKTAETVSKYNRYKRGNDSAATVFMKALGYEGVDVRGIKGLDNTKYGSVIYDLKGEDLKRKQEIGTAKFSDRDSDGNTLSKAQQEYFKDSKARDANGNLLVVYHGTPKGGFNEFDKTRVGTTSDYGYFGRGFYFTTKQSVAKYYAGYLNSSEIKRGYLNMTNPFVIGSKRDLKRSIEDIMGMRFEGENADYERSSVFTDWLIDNGYDGVICKDEYMILESNQFKNDDNTNPTGISDIRFSDRDREYMEAVDNNDMEKAEAFVREAAKRAGYKYEGFHGSTTATFTKFKDGLIYHAANKKTADFYTNRRDWGKEIISGPTIRERNGKYDIEKRSLKEMNEWLREQGRKPYKKASAEIADNFVLERANDWVYKEYLDDLAQNDIRKMRAYDSSNDPEPVKKYVDAWLSAAEVYERAKAGEELSMDDVKTVAAVIDAGHDASEYTSNLSFEEWDKYFGHRGSLRLSTRFSANDLKELLERRSTGNFYYQGKDTTYLSSIEDIRKYVRDNKEYDYRISRSGVFHDFIRMDNPLTVDAKGVIWESIYLEDDFIGTHETHRYTTDQIATKAKDLGYDGVIIKNVFDSALNDYFTTDEYIVFDGNQVKSAEAITMNEDGDVIPLSERFNSESNDIRYSDQEPVAEPDEATERINFKERSIGTRSRLAAITEDMVTTKAQKEFIANYRSHLEEAAKLEARLKKLDDERRKRWKTVRKHETEETLRERRSVNSLILLENSRIRRLEGTKTAMQIVENIQYRTSEAVEAANRRVAKADERAREGLDRYKQGLKAERERYENRREADLERYRDRLTKERARNEAWRDTYEKGEVKRKTNNEIKKLTDLLLHPTRDKNIPAVLQPQVMEALSAINTDVTQAEMRMKNLDDKIAAEMQKDAPDMDQIAIWERARANIEELGKTYDSKMQAIQMVFEKIKAAKNEEISNAYDPELAERINEMAAAVKGRSLNDLTLDELKEVREVVTMVAHRINTYRETLATEKKERIADLGQRVSDEVLAVGGEHKTIPSALHEIFRFLWTQAKPMQAFEIVGSKTLTELFDNVLKGEDVWAVDKQEAEDYAKRIRDKYGFDKWDLAKTFTCRTQRGDVEMSLNQIMSLYAYSKRKQAVEHMTKGGFVLDNEIKTTKKVKGVPVEFDVNIQTPYAITLSDFVAIQRNLTDDQRAFVEDMMKYLSSDMARKGNEVSRKLFGVDLFTEETYFPIVSAKQFLAQENRVKGDPQIKNKGMTKQIKPDAGNPIVLSDFTKVWSRHVEEMSLYHGLVLPMEDIVRVMNWSDPMGEGVRMRLDNAYGKEASAYISQLLKELNGGLQSDANTSLSNRMLTGFKRGATSASLSVIVQQPTSIFRAMGMIEPKYFKSGMLKSIRERNAVWEELKQWAPVALIKEAGSFDVDLGASDETRYFGKEYSTFGEKAKAVIKDADFRNDLLGAAPEIADQIAWCYMWEAAKNKIEAETNLRRGSDEFMKAASDLFQRVIRETQVYDSRLTRSQMMRSRDFGAKLLTTFAAEPTTTFNMLALSVIKALRGDKEYAKRMIGGIAASIIVNALVVSAVYAARDDDKDKTYGEKYIGELIPNIISNANPLEMLPIARDVVSLIQGYDVERADMSMVSDVIKAFRGLSSTTKTPYRKLEDFAGAIANIFGVPARNVMRDVRGMVNTAVSVGSSEEATALGMKYALLSAFGKDLSNGQQLYDAAVKGDMAHYNRVLRRIGDESKARSALRQAMRQNDERISLAAEARLSGNDQTAIQLQNQIIAEGHFTQDDIIAAINAEYNLIKRQEENK